MVTFEDVAKIMGHNITRSTTLIRRIETVIPYWRKDYECRLGADVYSYSDKSIAIRYIINKKYPDLKTVEIFKHNNSPIWGLNFPAETFPCCKINESMYGTDERWITETEALMDPYLEDMFTSFQLGDMGEKKRECEKLFRIAFSQS